MRWSSSLWPMFLTLSELLAIAVALSAQQKMGFVGDYAGALGPLPVSLHLRTAADGALSGTVDSPTQGLTAVPCANVVINGQSISFTVPTVRGTWTGMLSADHNSLTGIWSQAGGNPMPLNLTRVASADTGTSTASSASSPSFASGAPASSQAEPACTGAAIGGIAYYWDGSFWKQMTPPAVLEGRQGYSLKSGLKAGPVGSHMGVTTILRYENPVAPITVSSTPRFVMCALPSQATANFVIGKLDVKKNYREIESMSRYDAYGKETWIAKQRLQPVDVKRISEAAVEITPKSPLPPGQYVVAGPKIGGGTFDFGVQPN